MAEGGLSLPEGFAVPVSFSSDDVRTVPSAPGVDLVIDPSGEIVYAGKTGDLRRALGEHLQGDRQASVLHEHVGELLDRPGHTASGEEIREWLGRCTVSWRLSDDPAGLKAELVAALSPRFNLAPESPQTGVWWVYQGRSYDQESAVGIVFAGSAAPQVAHHLNVGRMAPGDVVIHCRHGKVVAIGETVAVPVRARRPYGPLAERDEGWLTRVEYFPLENPIAVAELPDRDGDEGPFNSVDQPKQGYLFPVESSFAASIRGEFADRWPAGLTVVQRAAAVLVVPGKSPAMGPARAATADAARAGPGLDRHAAPRRHASRRRRRTVARRTGRRRLCAGSSRRHA